ncbi:MAG: short-chain dehydrogenase, partial [Alphaproteobacteria bacterium]|nr:short-chain dehydrogenase [Alphaproteobacteria bacterium]
MDIKGKNVLVLGGAGLVGRAVCREILAQAPTTLVVASRRRLRAQRAVEKLKKEAPRNGARIIPHWGDVFVRSTWQTDDINPRAVALADSDKRRRLVTDVLDPLDEDIVASSMLASTIEGRAEGFDAPAADIVIDCMNTATALSYQNIYASAKRLLDLLERPTADGDQIEQIETILASLYIPQLVRHVQLLHKAMQRAGTEAYVKVGTTGTGGMGLNIPYTHGEEKPSRLLLTKAALAGAQTLLTFLLARTPGGPRLVKEIKPAAVIGWREIAYGRLRVGGRDLPIHDCPPDQAVSIQHHANLAKHGKFGRPTGSYLEGVYIDTGENGQFSAGEFAAITAIGQMELVTPEEIAQEVVTELSGGNTGRDVIAALDGAITGPSYRAGVLREAAINRLRQLEDEHGESVAFEILGPPRLSKLLFEAHLLKRVDKTISGVLAYDPKTLAADVEQHVRSDVDIRQRIISIGIPILLSDGNSLLRGPTLKSADPLHGWVDLTPSNMSLWQERLGSVQSTAKKELGEDTSSFHDRLFASSRTWS